MLVTVQCCHPRPSPSQRRRFAARGRTHIDNDCTRVKWNRVDDKSRGHVLDIAVVANRHRRWLIHDMQCCVTIVGPELVAKPVIDPVGVAQLDGWSQLFESPSVNIIGDATKNRIHKPSGSARCAINSGGDRSVARHPLFKQLECAKAQKPARRPIGRYRHMGIAKSIKCAATSRDAVHKVGDHGALTSFKGGCVQCGRHHDVRVRPCLINSLEQLEYETPGVAHSNHSPSSARAPRQKSAAAMSPRPDGRTTVGT